LISSSRIYILNKTNLTIKSDNAFIINDFNGHTLYFDRCHQLSFTGTLTILCNTGGRVDSHGIVIDRCDFSRIHNVLIFGDFTYGLSLLQSGNTSYSLSSYISNVFIRGARTGIYITGEYYVICNCFIFSCSVVGIHNNLAGNISIDDCTLTYNKVGIYVLGISTLNSDQYY
jgi:hypothetical protein